MEDLAVEDVRARRSHMVREQIAARGVADPRVLDAMAGVPREAFVPADLQDQAFADRPLPLGHGQTISQPYIVALMAEALDLGPWDRLLDVGAGCGYAAAVLGRLCAAVHALELLPALAAQAEANLRNAGVVNVLVRCADGSGGWPEAAPFDAIHVACAAREIPQALLDQLAEGGRLVIPLGEPGGLQVLVRVHKRGGGFVRQDLATVAFVPMK